MAFRATWITITGTTFSFALIDYLSMNKHVWRGNILTIVFVKIQVYNVHEHTGGDYE